MLYLKYLPLQLIPEAVPMIGGMETLTGNSFPFGRNYSLENCCYYHIVQYHPTKSCFRQIFFFFAQASTNSTQCFLPIQTLTCTKILNGDQTYMHSGLQFTSGNYFEKGKLHSYHCPRKRFLKVALAPIYEHSPPHRLGKALRAD